MKKLLAVGLMCAAAVSSFGDVLYSFDFETDGRITNNPGWRAYSGGDGSITNGGGQAWVGSGAEDVGATNRYADQTGLVYLGLDVNVQDGDTGASYTFGFLRGANTMAGRVFLDGVDASTYRVGIAGSGTTPTYASVSLTYGTTYRIVAGYNNATDAHTLWIDPLSSEEGSPDASVTLTVADNPNGFFIRQADTWDNGDVRWTADNLVIATDFASVVPEPGTATFMLIGLGALSAYRRRMAR